MPPELLSTQELAKALRVSRRTIVRYLERGWIKPTLTLPSGYHRFDLDEVKRQLAEHNREG